MNKRQFLQSIFTSSYLLSQKSFAMQNESLKNKKLIFIFLRGGADGLSFLIPYGKISRKERPNIFIDKKYTNQINDNFGINKSIPSFFKYYKNNNLILVPFSGLDKKINNHPYAQERLEFGGSYFNLGLLKRVSDVCDDAKIFSFTNYHPNIFKGISLLNNADFNNFESTNHTEQKLNVLLENNIFNDIQARNFLNTQKHVLKNMNSSSFFRKSLGEKIGLYISESGTNISFIDFGDWDFHTSQGNHEGEFNEQLLNLDFFLKNLEVGLKDEWSNTAIFMTSEFGRTIYENGSRGADHGYATLTSVFGGLIKKSSIITRNENIFSTNNNFLDIDFTYQSIMYTLLDKYFSFNKKSLQYIFKDLQK